jgi:hypothetical protein
MENTHFAAPDIDLTLLRQRGYATNVRGIGAG